MHLEQSLRLVLSLHVTRNGVNKDPPHKNFSNRQEKGAPRRRRRGICGNGYFSPMFPQYGIIPPFFIKDMVDQSVGSL